MQAERYLTCETYAIRKLVVIQCPRWPHIVSEAVCHPQPDLDIANIIRSAQVLDAKSPDPIYQRVVTMFDVAVIAYGNLEVRTCLSVWGDLVSMILGYSGPFMNHDKRG